MRRFSSVLLVDSRGWLLLQERDEFPEIDPERWGCPGGHLEGGETPLEGACREFAEETGVGLPPDSLNHWGDLEVRHAGQSDDDLVHVFIAPTSLCDGDITCMEGRQIRFVDPGEIPRLPMTRAGAKMLENFLTTPAYLTLFSPEESA